MDAASESELISKIKQADSAYKKTEVAAWEETIYPCEHTLTLFQQVSQKVKTGKDACCGYCDLKENLWICLVCGHLACGRQQVGGLPGNGHALQHFKDTNHSIAVKSGTISSEGTASVYCYACDNDVNDDQLPQHLSKIGIDVMGMEKTEKTITELNLDLNKNFNLSTAFEKGKSLEAVFGPQRTGIQNIGNSCYIASVLQSLFHVPEYKLRYLDAGQKHLAQCAREQSKCFMCQMSKMAHGICSGEFCTENVDERFDDDTGDIIINRYQDGIRPYMFRNIVGKGHVEFGGNKQQDAMEYLIHLINFTSNQEKLFKLKKLSDIFSFKLESRFKCKACDKSIVKNINSKYIKVPVPLPENFAEFTAETPKEDQEYEVDLSECLELFTSAKNVQFFCPNCNADKEFEKTECIRTFPKYLIMQVEKFALNGWVPFKLHTDIEFMDPTDFSIEELRLPEVPQDSIMESKGPVIEVDPIGLQNLMSMGYTENRCKRALMEAGNNIENAANFIFSTMDDPTQDDDINDEKYNNY